MTVTVLLADDEKLIRTALATLLPLDADIELVAEAGTGEQAVEGFHEHHPDVVVLDIEMPGVSGLEAAERILADHPGQAVLMLTRHARPALLRRALRLGVRGFLGKDADPAVIADAIIRLASGGRCIDDSVSVRALIDDCPLTAREQDVLRITREGYSVEDIAVTLHLSAGTVRNYLSDAIRKTPYSTRHEAARHAHERRWI